MTAVTSSSTAVITDSTAIIMEDNEGSNDSSKDCCLWYDDENYNNFLKQTLLLGLLPGKEDDTMLLLQQEQQKRQSQQQKVFLQIDWSPVHHWNNQKVNETFLLLILLCALQIAFMFTLAFRGKLLSIQTCYWIAAVQVAFLFGCVVVF